MDNEFKPRYFAPEEFTKCTPPCKIEDMDTLFLQRLDGLRACCGFPFYLSCAKRTTEYDLEHGRSGLSYHCKGRAVDVLCNDGVKRAKIISLAPAFGLRGIGVSSRFIHLDDREENIVWAYD